MSLAISVVIPAYNRAHMLAPAVTSAWSQKPEPPAEVIVVDDGSDDDTATVAEELGARVIRHPRNLGLAAARNTGVEAASCEWVALLDSDDEWLPHHLAHLWELRNGHAIVACSALRCGDDPAMDRIQGPAGNRPQVLRSPAQLIHPGNFIPVSAAMVRREAAIAAGGFQARRGVVEDLDLWLRMLQHETAVCSPRIGMVYRLHDEQMSGADQRTMQLAHLEAGEAHLGSSRRSRTLLRRFEGVAAWDNMRLALRAGERRAALSWAAEIIKDPQRLRGTMGVLLHRFLLRRRSGHLNLGIRAAVERDAEDLSGRSNRDELESKS
jgi:glycosyltransferase involved in cell wall biosynthesis